MKYIRKKLNNKSGFTILEVLIAALLTGIITASAFQFYVKLHSQSEAQFDLSETQQLCQASIQDIKRNLRMAGYKLPAGHEPYAQSGDSLYIFRRGTQPVDTILYYLEEFDDVEYSKVPNLPTGQQLFKLVKKTNSNNAQIFADYITDASFTMVDSSNIIISLETQTNNPDYSLESASAFGGNTITNDEGDLYFRTYSLSEAVNIRNVQ